MAKMTKNQLIDAIAERTQVSKGDVKVVIEQMATVGYKELNESGEFVIPGFAKMSVVNKPATEARSGVNPFTKEPMEFAAKPASKSVKASPLKVAKTLFEADVLGGVVGKMRAAHRKRDHAAHMVLGPVTRDRRQCRRRTMRRVTPGTASTPWPPCD